MKKLNKRGMAITRQLTITAMFTALVTVATVIIAIPATVGFLNVGDVAIMVTAACLGPLAGMTAGGLGSCIADLILGYGMYAPFTLFIKGLEGLICGSLICLFERLLGKRLNKYGYRVLFGVLAMTAAAAEMSALYCLADGILYGWGAAIANAPTNLIQGAIGIAAGGTIVYALNLPKIAAKYGVRLNIGDWKKKSEPPVAAELSDKSASEAIEKGGAAFNGDSDADNLPESDGGALPDTSDRENSDENAEK